VQYTIYEKRTHAITSFELPCQTGHN